MSHSLLNSVKTMTRRLVFLTFSIVCVEKRGDFQLILLHEVITLSMTVSVRSIDGFVSGRLFSFESDY